MRNAGRSKAHGKPNRITAQSGRRGMKHLGHFITAELFPADSGSRTKTVSARRPDANPTKVDLAFPASN
jgi:hypothetical protein